MFFPKNIGPWWRTVPLLAKNILQNYRNCFLTVPKNVLKMKLFQKKIVFSSNFRRLSLNFLYFSWKMFFKIVKTVVYVSRGTIPGRSFPKMFLFISSGQKGEALPYFWRNLFRLLAKSFQLVVKIAIEVFRRTIWVSLFINFAP